MSGRVYLIGAGCGDADLITIRGMQKLLDADVILYDNLVSSDILKLLPDYVEKIYVGKRFQDKSAKQDDINSLLVKKSKEGKTVARLKGGDPFIFARGAEELEVLKKYEIEYEIIPGISSATAVPALAGIPLTYRQLSRSITIVTASSHDGEKEHFSELDYRSLVKFGGTIVFLMGLHHLEKITSSLISSGMPKDMPCAVISQGGTKNQKTVTGNLCNIAEKVQNEKIVTPALVVVGECAGMAFEPIKSKDVEIRNLKKFKLSGCSIGICGTKSFFSNLKNILSELGADVCDYSFLDIKSIQNHLPNMKEYKWIVFTSPNGVVCFFEKMKQQKIDIRKLSHLKFAVIGPGTSTKLEQYGIFHDFMPEVFDSKNLGENLSEAASGEKILLCRSKNSTGELTEILERRKCSFVDFPIYELIEDKDKKERIFSKIFPKSKINYLVFGSASGVDSFFDALLSSLAGEIKIICIGERCAEALKKYGYYEKAIISKEYSIDGIIRCIEHDFLEGRYV